MSYNSFDDLAKLMKEVKTDISNQIANFKNEMDSRFKAFRTELQTDIDVISTRQDDIDTRLDILERASLSANLLLNGVPIIENENLNELFEQLCTQIGFTPKEFTLLSIFRVKNKSKQPTIVMKFISQNARNEFYQRYWKTKNLSLIDLGFETDSRVYVQESLTKANHEIFKQAMSLKRDKKLSSVYTYNGLVYVKSQPESTGVLIDSISHLSVYNKRKMNDISNSLSPLENDAKLVRTNNKQNKFASAKLKSTVPESNNNANNKNVNTNVSTPKSAPKSAATRIIADGTLDHFFSK